ncbi:MAG TPA: hypothetical protein VFW92_06490 [Candidatus Limnocylindrales bacterium]|nr:hypothetical protein [Candidatus Limnocylindrales bacterium]
MKYVVLESFRRDFERLTRTEKEAFLAILPSFVAACDHFATDPSTAWPASLRVKSIQGAPGILEMTWSFAGPDGRATFEWVRLGGDLAVRWRRMGGHEIFGDP